MAYFIFATEKADGRQRDESPDDYETWASPALEKLLNVNLSMQKALFLYNPAAGRGRIARNVGGIVDIFSENGWELTPEKIDFGAQSRSTRIEQIDPDGRRRRRRRHGQLCGQLHEKRTGLDHRPWG